jgi:co-chaperonin GroES (HSP10)
MVPILEKKEKINNKEENMKAIKNFIIKSEEAFSKSYFTESGLEIFADKRHSAERLSNRVVKVVSVPPNLRSGEIKDGYELMVDPTIFFRQQYEGRGEQDNPFMIDPANGLYMVEPKMVVLYRKGPEEDWKAFGDALLVEIKTKKVEKQVGALFLTETEEKIQVAFSNIEAEEMEVFKGDEVIIRKGLDVPFWIEGKEYGWIDNSHLLAKVN